jgi:hypothetical protein
MNHNPRILPFVASSSSGLGISAVGMSTSMFPSADHHDDDHVSMLHANDHHNNSISISSSYSTSNILPVHVDDADTVAERESDRDHTHTHTHKSF